MTPTELPTTEAAAPPAEAPPTRLLYAEDLRAGITVQIDRPLAIGSFESLSMALHGHQHDCSKHRQWATVLEVRERGGVYSCIVIDEAGQQQPLACNGLHLLTVRADR